MSGPGRPPSFAVGFSCVLGFFSLLLREGGQCTCTFISVYFGFHSTKTRVFSMRLYSDNSSKGIVTVKGLDKVAGIGSQIRDRDG